MVAGIEVEVPMEIRAAGLGDDVDHDRPLGVIGRKVRGKDLHLGNHVLVGGDRHRIAVRARIEGVTAVHGHVHRLTVDVFVIQRAVQVQTDRLPVVCLRVHAPVGAHDGARHHVHNLGGVAAHQGELLQVGGRDGVRFLARLHLRQLGSAAQHFNRFAGSPYFERNAHGAVVASGQGDAGCTVFLESSGGYDHVVGCRGQCRDGEIPVPVCGRRPGLAGSRVLDRNGRRYDHRSPAVQHGSAEGRKHRLRPRRRSGKGQKQKGGQ